MASSANIDLHHIVTPFVSHNSGWFVSLDRWEVKLRLTPFRRLLYPVVRSRLTFDNKALECPNALWYDKLLLFLYKMAWRYSAQVL